jgi:hypothetical protein
VLERSGILTLRVPPTEVQTSLQGVVDFIAATAAAGPLHQR